jgi:hypothetical protein
MTKGPAVSVLDVILQSTQAPVEHRTLICSGVQKKRRASVFSVDSTDGQMSGYVSSTSSDETSSTCSHDSYTPSSTTTKTNGGGRRMNFACTGK